MNLIKPDAPNGDGTDANAAGGTTPDANAVTPTPTEANADVNQRLLDESKKFKSRAVTAEKELAELKKKQLEEQGNYKKMYEDMLEKHSFLQKTVVKEKVSSAVKDEAAKAGCVDSDALFKLGDHSVLQYDEETHAVFGTESFVAEAKKKHAYLFKPTSQATVNPVTPGGSTEPKTLTPAEIAKLPQDQKMKYWAAAMKQSKH